MSFRLLGKCPNCNAEDEIIKPYEDDFKNNNNDKVKCANCETIWNDWLNFCFEEKRRGNRLIPVEIERHRNYGIELYWPSKSEIPFNGLIATVLNSALITKFNLDVCLATEGGVQKREPKGYELRNCDNNVGLYTGYGEDNVEKALDFYEKMMRQLFEEPLNFGNAKFRRGEILWLEENEMNYSNALIYLFGTLTTTTSKKFAKKVLLTKEKIEKNPFSAPHIRGLTYEEIARYFVPP